MSFAKDMIEEYRQLDCPECGAQPWLSLASGLREQWQPSAEQENTNWEQLRSQVANDEASVEWDHMLHCSYSWSGENAQLVKNWLDATKEAQ